MLFCIFFLGIGCPIAVAQEKPETKNTASAAAEVDSEIVLLPEFNVQATEDSAYLVTQSTTGTRMAMNVLDMPYSLSIITEDFIKDFQLFDPDDLAPYISGMAAGDPAQGGGGGTRLRGYPVPLFRNGFSRAQAPESSSIARVEVLKGPQSAIYGRVSPGGIVNYISKKPLTKFASGVNYTYGSYNYQRVTGYTSIPLVQDKLYLRVDAAYYDFDRNTDFWYNRTKNISASLLYKIDEDTTLTLENEYTARAMQGFQSFTRWRTTTTTKGTDPDGKAATTNYTHIYGSTWYMPNRADGERVTEANPNGADQTVDRFNDSTYLSLERRISETLSLRINAGYSKRTYEKEGTSTLSAWTLTPTKAGIDMIEPTWLYTDKGAWYADRYGSYQKIDYNERGLQVDLTKKWNTETIKQRTLITFDYTNNDAQAETWDLKGNALNAALADLGMVTKDQQSAWKRPDPFNPEVSGRYLNPDFTGAAGGWTRSTSNNYSNNQVYYGGLINHTMDMFDGRLTLVGSLRQDWGEYDYTGQKGDITSTTYSVGATYHIIPRKLVAYGYSATGFNPSPQWDPNTGEMLGNLRSNGQEVGIKGLLWNDAFSYSASVFTVTQENETTDNPFNPDGENPDLPRYIAGSTSRARGLSLDLTGEIFEGLTVLGNISWVDARITENDYDPTLVGTRTTSSGGNPPRSYAVALRYDFRDGFLKGLRLGLSYQNAQSYLRIVPAYTEKVTETDAARTYTITDQEALMVDEMDQWSCFIGYKFKVQKRYTIDLALNVINLFDQRRMTVAAYAPNGREVRVTASLKF